MADYDPNWRELLQEQLAMARFEKAVQDLDDAGIDTGSRIYSSGELVRGMENLTSEEMGKVFSVLH